METYKEKPDDSSDYYGGLEKGRETLITEAAVKLNQIIKESEEYNRYLNAMRDVMGNQDLYQAMNTFRRRNFELQGYDDGVNRYQEIFNLTMEYETVLRNPVVNDFLMAEQVLTKKLEEVYEIIADGLELDYSCME